MSPTFLARIRPNGPDASASGRKSIGSAKSRRPNEQAVVEVLVRPTRAELRRASADAAERLAAGRADADATTAGAGSTALRSTASASAVGSARSTFASCGSTPRR